MCAAQEYPTISPMIIADATKCQKPSRSELCEAIGEKKHRDSRSWISGLRVMGDVAALNILAAHHLQDKELRIMFQTTRRRG
jgi:hypothetical protein